MRHTIRIASILTLAVACSELATGLEAQSVDESRSIDRWLVTSTPQGIGAAVAPLVAEADRQFPDRALEIGPGMWHLVREDGAATLRFPGATADGATLAHAYVRSGREGSVELDASATGCSGMRVWLNGQALGAGSAPWTVRLADGWNTLLVALPASCPPEVSANLGTARVPLPRGARPLDPGRLRIQASRPPGIRANLPAGTVTVSLPRPAHSVWRAGSDELDARVEYVVTAWGRSAGMDTASEAAGEERGRPPTVDLTGDWTITLYLPMGVEMLGASLEMEEDGRLEGDLDGQRIDGSLRNGWVSGDRFGWTTRWSGVGRGVDVTFEGRVEDDRMSGTLEFDGPRQADPRPGFESSFGFEGHRDSIDEADAEPDSAAAPSPPEDEGPPRPRGRAPGPPTDTEALHAQIRQQLLPPRRPEAPAPASVSLELEFDGEELVDAVSGLEAAHPVTRTVTVPFAKVREAALDDRGLRARIAWGESPREREGRLSAAAVLMAFHAPILLETESGSGPIEGVFRVPEALDGFTLETLAGEWTVDGEPVAGGTLCDPCREGSRLRIRVTGIGEARVRVTDPGYPEAEEAVDAPPPEEWLRALSDGRRYREMGEASGS